MTNFDPPPEWMGPGNVVYCAHPDPDDRVMGNDADAELVRLSGEEPLLVLDITITKQVVRELRVLDPAGRVLYDSAVITFLASNYSPDPQR